MPCSSTWSSSWRGWWPQALPKGGSNRAKTGIAAELTCLVSLFHSSCAHSHHPLTLPVAFPSLVNLNLRFQTLCLFNLQPRLGFAHTELSRSPPSAPRGVVEKPPVAHGQEVWGCFSRSTGLGCFSPWTITCPRSWMSSLELCLSQAPVTLQLSGTAVSCHAELHCGG